MKRSEMIFIIACMLPDPTGGDYTAEEILERLEQEGMRPPVTGPLSSQIAAAYNRWEEE